MRYYYRLLSIPSKKIATFTITIGKKLTFGQPWHMLRSFQKLLNTFLNSCILTVKYCAMRVLLNS